LPDLFTGAAAKATHWPSRNTRTLNPGFVLIVRAEYYYAGINIGLKGFSPEQDLIIWKSVYL